MELPIVQLTSTNNINNNNNIYKSLISRVYEDTSSVD